MWLCDSSHRRKWERNEKKKQNNNSGWHRAASRGTIYEKNTQKQTNNFWINFFCFFVFLWSTSTGVISSFWCCWHNFRLTLDMCVCVMCAVTAVCGHASISHSRTIHEHGRRLRVYRYVCALGAWNCIYTMHDANEGMKKKKNARQKKTWYSMLAKIPAKPTTTTTEIHAQ